LRILYAYLISKRTSEKLANEFLNLLPAFTETKVKGTRPKTSRKGGVLPVELRRTYITHNFAIETSGGKMQAIELLSGLDYSVLLLEVKENQLTNRYQLADGSFSTLNKKTRTVGAKRKNIHLEAKQRLFIL